MAEPRPGVVARAIDAIVEPFSPAAVLRRRMDRQHLAQFEAGGPANRTTTTKRSTASGDMALDIAGTTIRERARWLDENHDLAIGILDVLVDKVVGQGIAIEPLIKRRDGSPHLELNTYLEQLHRDWAKRPEATWQHDLGGMERMIALHLFRDGEVLEQLVSGGGRFINHGTIVPFTVELIEADFLPLDFNDLTRNIRQGIERDAWGRPVAYWLYKQHPSDRFAGGISLPEATQLKRVSADSILFQRMSRRISQQRGVSVFVSVISRLGDLKQYENWEGLAAQVAAALTLFITRQPESDCPAWLQEEMAATSKPHRAMGPAMILEGLPGEKAEVMQSNRPSNQLEPFRKANLKAAASGTGAGYSSISKSYDGTYSSQRQELVEQDGHYRALRAYFVSRCSRPIYERFILTAQLAGLLDRLLQDADPTTLFDAQFTGVPMPWVDPLKEIEAKEKELGLGITSRSQLIRERGGNPREIAAQINRDNEELPFPVLPAKQPAAPAPQRQENPTDG